MADSLIVQIDVELLMQNFNRTDIQAWNVEKVKEWLRECGFREQPDGWLCEQIFLDALDTSEYTIARRL